MNPLILLGVAGGGALLLMSQQKKATAPPATHPLPGMPTRGTGSPAVGTSPAAGMHATGHYLEDENGAQLAVYEDAQGNQFYNGAPEGSPPQWRPIEVSNRFDADRDAANQARARAEGLALERARLQTIINYYSYQVKNGGVTDAKLLYQQITASYGAAVAAKVFSALGLAVSATITSPAPVAATTGPVGLPNTAPAPVAGAPAAPAADSIALVLNGVTDANYGTLWPVAGGVALNGYVQVRNPTSQSWTYHLQLIWKGPSDGSGYAQTDVELPAGATYRWPINIIAPSTPGSYKAYFGLYAGGVVLNDPAAPEGGWDLTVKTPHALTDTVTLDPVVQDYPGGEWQYTE